MDNSERYNFTLLIAFTINTRFKLIQRDNFYKDHSLALKPKLWFSMLNQKSITHSDLSSIFVTEHHTSCRTSSSWWV